MEKQFIAIRKTTITELERRMNFAITDYNLQLDSRKKLNKINFLNKKFSKFYIQENDFIKFEIDYFNEIIEDFLTVIFLFEVVLLYNIYFEEK